MFETLLNYLPFLEDSGFYAILGLLLLFSFLSWFGIHGNGRSSDGLVSIGVSAYIVSIGLMFWFYGWKAFVVVVLLHIFCTSIFTEYLSYLVIIRFEHPKPVFMSFRRFRMRTHIRSDSNRAERLLRENPLQAVLGDQKNPYGQAEETIEKLFSSEQLRAVLTSQRFDPDESKKSLKNALRAVGPYTVACLIDDPLRLFAFLRESDGLEDKEFRSLCYKYCLAYGGP